MADYELLREVVSYARATDRGELHSGVPHEPISDNDNFAIGFGSILGGIAGGLGLIASEKFNPTFFDISDYPKLLTSSSGFGVVLCLGFYHGFNSASKFIDNYRVKRVLAERKRRKNEREERMKLNGLECQI